MASSSGYESIITTHFKLAAFTCSCGIPYSKWNWQFVLTWLWLRCFVKEQYANCRMGSKVRLKYANRNEASFRKSRGEVSKASLELIMSSEPQFGLGGLTCQIAFSPQATITDHYLLSQGIVCVQWTRQGQGVRFRMTDSVRGCSVICLFDRFNRIFC